MSFEGLEIGRRGVIAHQAALENTGHNISNADNKEFSRQRVLLQANDPLYVPGMSRADGAGQKGQGVDIKLIERIRNSFIDDRIISTTTQKNFWGKKDNYLYQMEKIFNEPSDNSLRSGLDEIWAAWQELSKFPEDIAHREVLIQKSNALSARVRDTFSKLDRLRRQADSEMRTGVKEINNLASSLQQLNESIVKSEALGDLPNDLKDRRDAVLEKLSRFINIKLGRSDKDELMVYIGSDILVQGEKRRVIDFVPDGNNEGFGDLRWHDNAEKIIYTDGEMQALKEVRDVHLKENISKLDLLATNITDITNEVHKDGFGLSGRTNLRFFKNQSLANNVQGNFDLNNDGTAEVSAIFRVTGVNKLQVDKPIGVQGAITFYKNDDTQEPVSISYKADESLQSIIDKINQEQSGIVAYMNHDNKLALKADVHKSNWKKNFMISHLEDSGEFLVGFAGILNASGPDGSFDSTRLNDINKFQAPREHITLTPAFHPAAWMNISDEIKNNPILVAASRGKDIGGTGDYNSPNGAKDGNNALIIARAIKHRPSMIGQSKTPDDFYNSLIAKLATVAAEAKDQNATSDLMLQNLVNQRQSISGVNLDEEMANLIQFQHGYNASARLVRTMDEMLDTIINRLKA